MQSGTETEQVRVLQRERRGIGGQQRQIHSVPLHHLRHIQPVNGAECIQTVDGRNGPLVLDIRKPAQCDGELVAPAQFGDVDARLLHVPIPQIQPLSRALQLLSRILHVMIPAIILGLGTAKRHLPDEPSDSPGIPLCDYIRRRISRASQNGRFCSEFRTALDVRGQI